MPITTLTNVRLFTGGADLTANTNQIELAADRAELDATTFLPEGDPDSGWTKVAGGLASSTASGGGFWEAGDASRVDDATWAALGGVGAWTVCPAGAAVGSLSYSSQMLTAKYMLGGAVGDLAPYTVEGSSSGPLVRGLVLHPPGTSRTASGTGTAVQLGAATATQRLYLFLHVLSITGTLGITVRVETDDLVGFASPTTRVTAAAATARGGQAVSVAGPITDTFARAAWTTTGTGSALFVAAAGIA